MTPGRDSVGPVQVAPGDRLVGKYLVERIAGVGGMSVVVAARHEQLDKTVAIKLLAVSTELVEEAVARFLREARAAASLRSEHIARVTDVDVDELGRHFIVMEYLEGHDLAAIVRDHGPLPLEQAIGYLLHACEGVAEAHANGILHRDLKPQNLFRHGETWKILDFGVATLAEENTGTLTQGGIVGTPHYMAAEQAQSKRVDLRADLYAIAAIAYRCFTGRHPFTAPDTPALLFQVVHAMPPRPGELVELHEDIDRWFAIAMAKSPDDRFASGGMLAATLVDAASGKLDAALRRRADQLLKSRGWGI